MESLDNPLDTLKQLRSESKMEPFFSRIDRLVELELLIIAQAQGGELLHTELNREADTKRKWLEDHGADFGPHTSTGEEFDAIAASVNAISDNNWFYLKNIPE